MNTAEICAMVVMVIELVKFFCLFVFVTKIKHDHNNHLFLVVLPVTDVHPLETKVF